MPKIESNQEEKEEGIYVKFKDKMRKQRNNVKVQKIL